MHRIRFFWRGRSREGEAGSVFLLDPAQQPFGLPDPAPSTFLIVSAITADAARKSGRNTDDLLLPTDLVRDSEGQIIGCYRLAIYNHQSKGGFG